MGIQRVAENAIVLIELGTDRNRLRKLAGAHIRRFENLIRSGHSNVRIGECEEYLFIWRGVLAAAARVDVLGSLTREMRREIQDARDCGDYEDLFEPS